MRSGRCIIVWRATMLCSNIQVMSIALDYMS